MKRSSLAGKRVAMVGLVGYTDLRLVSALKKVGARTVSVTPNLSTSLTVAGHEPDVVLMWVNRLTLSEAVEACRIITAGHGPCLVALTHQVEDEGCVQLTNAGASAVVSTPFNAESLVPELQEIMQLRSAVAAP